MLPEIVLFGLIFVNFFPPIILPTTQPPISEKMQTNKRNKTISGPTVAFIMYAECINNNNKATLEIFKIPFKFEFTLIFLTILKNSCQQKKETTNNKINHK